VIVWRLTTEEHSSLSHETDKQKSQLRGDDHSDRPEVVMHISIGDEASANVGTVRSNPLASADSTKMTTVTFGSVTVTGPAPSEAVVRENIAASRRALEGALDAFEKPGIRLPRRRNVPLSDPNEPNILIRELNGREERGTMSEGQFIIAK
jgi:hypothetical protein